MAHKSHFFGGVRIHGRQGASHIPALPPTANRKPAFAHVHLMRHDERGFVVCASVGGRLDDDDEDERSSRR